MATAFERRQEEGVRKSFPGTCGELRILCKAGRLNKALQILNQGGTSADSVSYVWLLQESIKMKGLAQGKQVHTHIIRSGFKPNIFVLNTLINMYAKCGSIADARLVFDNMTERDMFTWNIIMAGYTKLPVCGSEAFGIYDRMIQEGVIPNAITFICVLKACASLVALEKGREVHVDIIRAGIVSHVNLENALVNMYAKCGSMTDARQVFNNMLRRDMVSWTAMIAGYAKNGCGREALEMYEQMIQEGVMPDKVTFTCIVNACASLAVLEKGKGVHAVISKAGIAPDIILDTALVNMYAKCGSLKDAGRVFDNMAQRNVVSWSAMIAGYAQHGCGQEALETYEQMIHEGVGPNRVTFISVVQACASLSALEKGKVVHVDIIKAGILPDVILETALADMYTKCGSMKDARAVFDNMVQQNVVAWNTMIAGYGQHGCAMEALQLFERMKQDRMKPNCISFICLLSACKSVGLVSEGIHYFNSMSQDHGLTPTLEHFSCMVDLLGRAGRLDEAEDFINRMPTEPGASVWGALLGACRIHGDLKVAERAAKCLLKQDPQRIAT